MAATQEEHERESRLDGTNIVVDGVLKHNRIDLTHRQGCLDFTLHIAIEQIIQLKENNIKLTDLFPTLNEHIEPADSTNINNSLLGIRNDAHDNTITLEHNQSGMTINVILVPSPLKLKLVQAELAPDDGTRQQLVAQIVETLLNDMTTKWQGITNDYKTRLDEELSHITEQQPLLSEALIGVAGPFVSKFTVWTLNLI